jgi:hypothetical protein
MMHTKIALARISFQNSPVLSTGRALNVSPTLFDLSRSRVRGRPAFKNIPFLSASFNRCASPCTPYQLQAYEALSVYSRNVTRRMPLGQRARPVFILIGIPPPKTFPRQPNNVNSYSLQIAPISITSHNHHQRRRNSQRHFTTRHQPLRIHLQHLHRHAQTGHLHQMLRRFPQIR